MLFNPIPQKAWQTLMTRWQYCRRRSRGAQRPFGVQQVGDRCSGKSRSAGCSASGRLGRPLPIFAAACVIILGYLPAGPLGAADRKGQIEVRVTDEDTGQLIGVNMFLKDAGGRSRSVPKLPFWNDHFAMDGTVVLNLPPGKYTFELERGPEYPLRSGNFEITRGAKDVQNVSMRRFVDMKEEGWWSGDLHVHRPPAEIPLLMKAQDLHVVPVITWWNERNAWKDAPLPDPPLVQLDADSCYYLLGGEDEREGGALLYFNLPRPLDLPPTDQREYPPMSEFLELAKRQPGAFVDIEKPFWWDVPVWLALGLADSIGLAHNHMLRGGMLDNEAWGKPRDPTLYPSPRGNGYWSQDIYYHILNCGIRIPPSAGSASGVLDNPVGYNRVYVYCGETFNYQSWWDGLRQGRVVVTNGPLLRPRVNGHPPGHVFSAEPGETVELSVDLNLGLRDRVDYLEVVQNGKVVHEVRLEEYRNRKGSLPPVTFQESGWLLVRAVCGNGETFRFASTGPYYVQMGNQSRISRESAQFFRDWVEQRIERLKLPDAQQQAAALRYQYLARDFWQKKLDQANAP